MAKAATQFSDLPREIRDLIWEETLPPPRLFQQFGLRALFHTTLDSTSRAISPRIQLLYQVCFGANLADLGLQPGSIYAISFHIRYPPPIATQVCRESRDTARRAGFFLLPAATSVKSDASETPPLEFGVLWFGGSTDILYQTFPRGRSDYITNWDRYRHLYIPNSERVRNVGVGWRALLQGTPLHPLTPSNDAQQSWRTLILALYNHWPGLETMRLMIPIVNNGRRFFVDREAGGEKKNAILTPLALSETLPRVLPLPSGLGAVLELLRGALEQAHDHELMVGLFGDDVRYPPRLEGLGLERERPE
ncbi:hypothetical protein IMZ48_07265 [Candidatus Bathyarchaeota archaeon]|nr:hypothetical protein [Candidatus Bathyarchaeota archaeon]